MSNLVEVGKTYTHYKNGSSYKVLSIAIHSETGEEMVVYQAMYWEHMIYVRPLSMWNEVIPKDRQTEYGQEIRFKLVDKDVMDEEWLEETKKAYREMKLV